MAQLDVLQDAEFMEQKKSERAARGADAWQPQARQQELDEADRFQVKCLGHSSSISPNQGTKDKRDKTALPGKALWLVTFTAMKSRTRY